MSLQNVAVLPLSPQAFTKEVGFGIKKSGIITVGAITDTGVALAEYFKLLKVTTGGDLVVLGLDGNYMWVPAVLSGGWVPIWGSAVVTSASVSGVTKTTTASGIAWFSGM